MMESLILSCILFRVVLTQTGRSLTLTLADDTTSRLFGVMLLRRNKWTFQCPKVFRFRQDHLQYLKRSDYEY